jgi:hypothetical protein
MKDIKIYTTTPKDFYWGLYTVELAILYDFRVLYYNSKMMYSMLNENYDDMKFYLFDKSNGLIFFHEMKTQESSFYKIIDLKKLKIYDLDLNEVGNSHLNLVVKYDFELIGIEIIEKYKFVESEFIKDNFKNNIFNFFKWKLNKL